MTAFRRIVNYLLESSIIFFSLFFLLNLDVLYNFVVRFYLFFSISYFGNKIIEENYLYVSKALKFNIDIWELNLDSMVLAQRSWTVLFVGLSLILFLYFRNSLLSFKELKEKNWLEEVKENKIYFLILLVIALLSIQSILNVPQSPFLNLETSPCANLDSELFTTLRSIFFARKMVLSSYFILVLMSLIISKKKPIFLTMIFWYFLKHMIVSLHMISWIQYDIAVRLHFLQSIPMDSILEAVGCAFFFITVYCMDEAWFKFEKSPRQYVPVNIPVKLYDKYHGLDPNKVKVVQKVIVVYKENPCQKFQDELNACLRWVDQSHVGTVLDGTHEKLGKAYENSNDLEAGRCQRPLLQPYLDCLDKNNLPRPKGM